LSVAIGGHLVALEGDDSRLKQRAAKMLYRHHREDPRVQQLASDILLEQYNLAPRDRYHVDAMAFLCNILGSSRDPQFRAALIQVRDSARSPKLRKYAAKNLGRVR
jgi:hypothetical protein